MLSRAIAAALAAALLGPGVAQAASVSITTGPDPRVDAPVDGTVSYDMAGNQGDVEVFGHRGSRECAPDSGTEAVQPDSETLLRRAAEGSGSHSFGRTYSEPGPVRFCAYLTSMSNETLASASHAIDLRDAAGAIEVTGARLAAPSDSAGSGLTGGGEFYVDVRGSSESTRRLAGMLVPVAAACPARWEGEPDRELRAETYSVQGEFAASFLSAEVASGPWRACVYLVGDASAPPTARAERVIEARFAPRNIHRPAVVVAGLAARVVARCSPGDWIAWPRPRIAYAWRVNGRIVRGARRSKLAVRAGSRVACRVTLTNAIGRRSAWSKVRRA